jgi:hypothetical protein
MIRWTLKCPQNHEQGIFETQAQALVALRDADDGALCERCGERRRVSSYQAFSGPQVIPDIPEHYNVTIDERVRSRAHLREIQRTKGYQDYEPRGDQRARMDYALKRARHPHTVRMGG